MKARRWIPWITALIVVASASALYVRWWVETPEYSLYRIRRAYRNHDYREFTKYFDVDGIAESAGEKFVRSSEESRAKAKDKSSECETTPRCEDAPLTYEERIYWRLRVRSDIVQWYQSAFNNALAPPDSAWLGDFSSGRTQISHGTALVDIRSGSRHGKVRMTRIAARKWKVVEITEWEWDFGDVIWH